MQSGSFVYFDEPFLTIRWDDENKVVWLQWREPIDSASFRRGVETGLELLKMKKARRWLADCLNMGPVELKDTKWVSDEWMPRAVPHGFKWIAFIMAKNVVTSMGIKVLLSNVGEEEVATAYFDDVEEARRWLRDQR